MISRTTTLLQVKNTFLYVAEEHLDEEEGGSESIWQRSVTAPASTGPRKAQSLPITPRLGSFSKVDKSDTTSVEDSEGKDTGYDTPDEFLDDLQSETWNSNRSTMGEIPPYLYAFAPEEAQDGGMGDPCAWQGWIVTDQVPNMMPFSLQCHGHISAGHGQHAGEVFTPERVLEEKDKPPDWGNTVTAMMRNLPKKLTQHMLLEEINSKGFAGTYDFVYLPMDIESKVNRGYAFINFMEPAYAAAFKSCYEGSQLSQFSSRKVIAILPAVLQGLEANHAHFATARVTREDPSSRPLFLRQPSGSARMPEAPECRRVGRGTEGGRNALQVAAKAAAAAGTKSRPRPRAGARTMTGSSTASTTSSCAASAPDGVNDGDISDEQATCVVNFCPFCGGHAGKDFRFCQFCGHSLKLGRSGQ